MGVGVCVQACLRVFPPLCARGFLCFVSIIRLCNCYFVIQMDSTDDAVDPPGSEADVDPPDPGPNFQPPDPDLEDVTDSPQAPRVLDDAKYATGVKDTDMLVLREITHVNHTKTFASKSVERCSPAGLIWRGTGRFTRSFSATNVGRDSIKFTRLRTIRRHTAKRTFMAVTCVVKHFVTLRRCGGISTSVTRENPTSAECRRCNTRSRVKVHTRWTKWFPHNDFSRLLLRKGLPLDLLVCEPTSITMRSCVTGFVIAWWNVSPHPTLLGPGPQNPSP